MKIGICDDASQQREHLKALLVSNTPDFTIIEYTSGEELLLALSSGHTLDLLFLDIYMDGINGIDTAKKIRETNKNLPIIFLTMSPEFALSAFGVRAAGYLLKPVKADVLFPYLEELCVPSQAQSDIWVVETQEGMVSVHIADLLYCEQRGKYGEVHLADGSLLRLRTTFTDMERQVEAYSQLFACGRSYLLNLRFVRTLNRQEVVLSNGYVIPVPRNVYPALREAYLKLYKREG